MSSSSKEIYRDLELSRHSQTTIVKFQAQFILELPFYLLNSIPLFASNVATQDDYIYTSVCQVNLHM